MGEPSTKKCDLKTSVDLGAEEQKDEGLTIALERKETVLKFLKKDLNKPLLKTYHLQVKILAKCSFYLEILPRYLPLGDQNLIPMTMSPLVDPCKFRRMKKIGTFQTKIQILLLEEFLEQLQKGRVKLKEIVQSYSISSFLTKWNYISQCLSNITGLLDNFLSMLVPGPLYMKHHLILDVGGIAIPKLQLVLTTKPPVVFDRLECKAHENWISLKWYTHGQETQTEKYDLFFQICQVQTTQHSVQESIVSISTNHLVIRHLLQDQIYEFSIRRAETSNLVYEAWHDVITLKTQQTRQSTALSHISQLQETHN
ncbi:fibronectin type III domain-containing protein 11 isoform X2 [Pseudophryne corroboree]